jgi:protein-S-isoprenylcysteine O-methyltransferase Ste14
MIKPALSITKQAIIGLAALSAFLWLLLFLPAWTLNYWQAWIFWAVFLAGICAVSAYFLRRDLNLIASRLKVGYSEKENIQKITQAIITLFFILLIFIPPFDHKYGWSNVPALLSLVGDVFVAVGLLIIFLVFKENSYTSVIIEVNQGQRVISTGLYSKVRHPMYSGALIMLLATPLALGSFWGLLAFPPILATIVVRIVSEEKFLAKNLSGYSEYCLKVRFRLIPFVW